MPQKSSSELFWTKLAAFLLTTATEHLAWSPLVCRDLRGSFQKLLHTKLQNPVMCIIDRSMGTHFFFPHPEFNRSPRGAELRMCNLVIRF